VRRIALVVGAAMTAVSGCSSGLATMPAGPPPNALSDNVICAQIRDEYARFADVAVEVLTSTTRALPKLAFINIRDSAAANLKAIAASGTGDATTSAGLLAQAISRTGITSDGPDSQAQLTQGLLLYRSACGTSLG